MTQVKFPLEQTDKKYDATEKETTESENVAIKTVLNETGQKKKKIEKINRASVSCGQY